MRRRAGLLTVLPALAAMLASAAAADLDADLFMPVDEIESGMKGYGLTVFAGTRIDTFQVEILGVRNSTDWTDWDLIWGRLAGGPLAETGLIAGMSGSPVYIDGRMIGAVGYGFPFSDEPLAGITPIGQMLRTFEHDRPSERENTSDGSYQSLLGGLLSGRQPASAGAALEELIASVEALAAAGGGVPESVAAPLQLPLMIGGVDSQTLRHLSPGLERLGFVPLEARGGGSSTAPSPALEPGAGIGVQFIRGDLNLSGYGTLTYRDRDDILAFGHPMMFMGHTELPMTTVDIHFVVPTIIQSFKYGSVIEMVGSITQDRVSAIAGVIGRVPTLTPLSIAVRDADRHHQFEFEMIRHKGMTPILAWIASMRTIGSIGKLAGDYAIASTATVEIARSGHPPRSLEVGGFASGGDASMMAGISLAQVLTALLNNPFEEVEIAGISVEIELQEVHRQGTLQSLRVSENVVRPGETIEVALRLRPHLGDEETVTLQLEVPADLANGMLEVRVADALTARQIDRRQAPGRYNPNNLDEFLGLIEDIPRANGIVVELFLRRPGATVGAMELPSLPASMLGVVRTTRQAGELFLLPGTTVARQQVEVGYAVRGQRSLALRVDRGAR